MDGALGMPDDELRHTAQQKALNAALAVRAKDDQIGVPLCRGVEDALANVACLDGGYCLEAIVAELLRYTLDQLMGRLLQVC